MTPRPFRYRAPDAALDDLRRRLAATRWPAPLADGWTYGTDAAWLDAVLPGGLVRIGDLDVHFARVRARRATVPAAPAAYVGRASVLSSASED